MGVIWASSNFGRLPEECRMDIALIVDSSSSINTVEYNTVRRWLMTIVDTMISEKKGLNTGEGGARVSIMQFSGKSGINKQTAFNRKDYFSYLGKDRVVDFNFVTKNSKEALMRKIGSMQRIPNAPDTCLGEALLWFRKNMLTRAAGMRPNTPKKIIVMTDGYKNCPMSIAESANPIKRMRNTEVYAIGVGQQCRVDSRGNRIGGGCYMKSELEEIASRGSKKYIYEVTTFEELVNSVKLVQENCKPPPPPRCFKEVDINLVLDGSRSLGPKRFANLKAWVASLVQQFTIGADKARVGLVHFSTSVNDVFEINQHGDIGSILSAIENLKYKEGITSTGQALEKAKTLFRHDPARKQVLVLITDGKSNDKKVDFNVPAAAIRNMGVDIIAIGAGSVDKTQLLEMTGQRSDKIFTAEKYRGLAKFTNRIVDNICKAPLTCDQNVAQLCYKFNQVGASELKKTNQLSQSLEHLCSL